jgi:hypothetical protein
LGYVWALLTNRQFSIDITHPCPLTSIVEPNVIFWNKSIKCYDYFSNVVETESQNFSSVLINKMNDFGYLTEFKNLSLIDYFSNVNLLILKANLDYIQPLSENPALKEKILSLGLVDKIEDFKIVSLFRRVYNKLFKLRPEYDKQFQNFKIKAKANKTTKLFCVQIRIGGSRPHVGGDRKFTLRNNSKLFWDFIRSTIINDEENYKLFVTSDTESVANESLDEFGEEKVVMIDGLYNHLDVGPSSKTSCKMYTKTFLDLHAFQLCDKVVVSRGGYGLMGAFLRENPFQEFYRYTEIHTKTEDVKTFIKLENLKELEENLQHEIDWVKSLK